MIELIEKPEAERGANGDCDNSEVGTMTPSNFATEFHW